MTIKLNGIFKLALFIGAAGLFAGCTHYGDSTDDTDYADKGSYGEEVCTKDAPTPVKFATRTATPAERSACEAAGGEVIPSGLAGFDMCVLPYCDGGDVCTDSSDCIGKCYLAASADASGGFGSPASGQCQINSSPFGCRTEISGGTLGATLCID